MCVVKKLMGISETVVLRLSLNCDLGDVEEGKIYIGKVQGFATFGTFVLLNDRIKGLVHKSNGKVQHNERDTIFVKVLGIRNNGNIDLEELIIPHYSVEEVEKKSQCVRIKDLSGKIGRSVAIEGQVEQIKQTSGPTIFTIADESGTQNVAGFVEAGVRAFPEVAISDIVRVVGEVMRRNNQIQIEADAITVLSPEEAVEVRVRIEKALDIRAEPEDVPLLVQSDVLAALRPEMKKIAKIIRKAVFTSQPIILRHHADADGICSAVAIEQAVISLIKESGGDYDAD